jgi:hypothetical protein
MSATWQIEIASAGHYRMEYGPIPTRHGSQPDGRRLRISFYNLGLLGRRESYQRTWIEMGQGGVRWVT